MSIIIGIGARASATSADVLAVIDDVLEQVNATRSDVQRLACLDKPQTNGALQEAAKDLMVPLNLHPIENLRTCAPRCQTHSALVIEKTGVPSIAEAAALASAGPATELLLPRIKHARVTAAAVQINE